MSALYVSSRAAVALVLLMAGAAKLRDADAFARVVLGYKIVPWPLARVIARVLPPFEITVAIGVLGGVLGPWTELAATTLFVVFAVALSINLARGRRDLDCGCFGSGGRHRGISWWHAARAIALAVLSGTAAWAGRPSTGEVGATVALVAVTAMAIIAATTVRQLNSSPESP